MKIAIIGSGISGLGAAWLLHQDHDITVFEKDHRIGGHSNTAEVDYDGTPIPVDTGFIVYNELNYPNLTALFRTLNVDTIESNMSFAVSAQAKRLEWSSDSLATIFAQKRNMANPSFLAMIYDILRFNRIALRDLDSGLCTDLPLGEYIAYRGFGRSFKDHYILPMGAAIWSTSLGSMLDFPAESLIRFFDNHRLLSYARPLWRTVDGGSRTYVARLTAPFQDRIHTGLGIRSVMRSEDGVTLVDDTGAIHRFDHAILACHSDQALRLLSDADDTERAILGDIAYAPNTAYLHRDPALMPERKTVWASWNVMADKTEAAAPVSVTYWMNRLQNLNPACPLFVSLNPATPPRDDLVFGTYTYDHPQFTQAALKAQRRLDEIQGARRTWFCGAWCGYGFHEDGLAAGLEAAERLSGLARPWAADDSVDAAPAARAAE